MYPSGVQATTAQNKRDANNDRNTTDMTVEQVYWMPFENRNDPRSNPIMLRVCEGPKPFQMEGIIYQVNNKNVVDDDDACPFHNEIALEIKLGKIPRFKYCCKKDYLRRMLKAKQKNNFAMAVITYEPLVRDECKAILEERNRLGKTSENPLDVTQYARRKRGYMDIGLVRFKVPKQFVSKVKETMGITPTFHTISDYEWIYIGFIPMKIPYIGIMSSRVKPRQRVVLLPSFEK